MCSDALTHREGWQGTANPMRHPLSIPQSTCPPILPYRLRRDGWNARARRYSCPAACDESQSATRCRHGRSRHCARVSSRERAMSRSITSVMCAAKA